VKADVVFCLPHAGGGAHSYLGWTPYFGKQFEWLPLDYAGHFTRSDESRYLDFTEAVNDISRTIEVCAAGRTFGLFGHSMGGALAFEVGCRLEDMLGTDRLTSVVISSTSPPNSNERTAHKYFEFTDDDLLRHLTDIGGIDTSVLSHKEFLTDYLSVIRDHYRLYYSYKPTMDAVLSCALQVWHGDSDVVVKTGMKEWESYSTGTVDMVEYAGNHFYWHGQAEAVSANLRCCFGHDICA
jgi:surfactin synthase thioesterase subunit